MDITALSYFGEVFKLMTIGLGLAVWHYTTLSPIINIRVKILSIFFNTSILPFSSIQASRQLNNVFALTIKKIYFSTKHYNWRYIATTCVCKRWVIQYEATNLCYCCNLFYCTEYSRMSYVSKIMYIFKT